MSSEISPKSVVSSGTGYVFAQNMMYKHTITVYDSKTAKLVKTIQDEITAADFHVKGHGETIRGAPVECAFTPDGRFAYISQYSMYGTGFIEGHDTCSPGGASDSYVYRVSLADLKIDKVIKVGEVPKYLAVTPDQKYLLVSNWCSYSLTVIDIHTSKVVKSVYLGPYPRGIAVSPDSKTAYVAVMGTTNIAVVDLTDFSLSWISGVGARPAAPVHGRQRQVPVRDPQQRGQRRQDRPEDRAGRRQGLHGVRAAQHGDRPRRQVAVRRQLQLEHDEPGPHERHEGHRQRRAPTRCRSGSRTTRPPRACGSAATPAAS